MWRSQARTRRSPCPSSVAAWACDLRPAMGAGAFRARFQERDVPEKQIPAGSVGCHYVLRAGHQFLFLPFLPSPCLVRCFCSCWPEGSYSAGLVFFAGKHRYSHVIWHLFVNGGALCHLAALVWLR